MFCAAMLLLEQEVRAGMLWLIGICGLTPVLVGNAVAWSLYFRIKRAASAPESRKTIQQELLEAASQEAAKRERKAAKASGAPKTPEAPKAPEPTPEETFFGPESAGGPSAFHSEEEEVMLLYMDDGEDEAGDN